MNTTLNYLNGFNQHFETEALQGALIKGCKAVHLLHRATKIYIVGYIEFIHRFCTVIFHR
jgi:hypothetical protein